MGSLKSIAMKWVVGIHAVINLASTFQASLISCLAKLTIGALISLLIIFADLGTLDITLKHSLCVATVPPVRFDYIIYRRCDNVEVVHVTDVPVAHFIEFDVAHVSTSYL